MFIVKEKIQLRDTHEAMKREDVTLKYVYLEDQADGGGLEDTQESGGVRGYTPFNSVKVTEQFAPQTTTSRMSFKPKAPIVCGNPLHSRVKRFSATKCCMIQSVNLNLCPVRCSNR